MGVMKDWMLCQRDIEDVVLNDDDNPGLSPPTLELIHRHGLVKLYRIRERARELRWGSSWLELAFDEPLKKEQAELDEVFETLMFEAACDPRIEELRRFAQDDPEVEPFVTEPTDLVRLQHFDDDGLSPDEAREVRAIINESVSFRVERLCDGTIIVRTVPGEYVREH